MNRRTFIAGAATIPLVGHAALVPVSALAGPEADENHTSATGPVPKVGPDLSRYRLTLNRVLHGSGPAYTPEFLLEDIHATPGRRFTNFSGDLSGRWIGALSASAKTFGDSFRDLDSVVSRTVALQHADGYFGSLFHYDHPDDNDLALLWGNGRLLVGLMEYYTLARDPAVLTSARKLGDFLIRIGNRFNSQEMADAFGADHYASSYICWTQQTEGLAALYAATQEVRYRDLCAAIASRIARRPGDHVHGYLSSLRGTLNLYEATGDPAYLRQVVAAWKDIRRSGDVLLTGGVPERWTPKRERTEGCAECDWLRLNLALYRTTGERVYLDTAQNIYFNDFSMNQFATGDFGHAKLDPRGIPQIVYVRAWWCCTLHGLRTFADIQSTSFRTKPEHTFYDFPVDSQIQSEAISARASSSLGTNGTVQITVRAAAPGHKLTVSPPSWADAVRLSRNGAGINGLTVEKLVPGDVILVSYDMTLRVENYPSVAGQIPAKSLHFGPWLLGIPANVNSDYFNELFAENLFELPVSPQSSGTSHSVFEVPLAHARGRYIPAEFPERPASAEIRSIADQTATQPQNWQLLFAFLERHPTEAPVAVTSLS